MDSVTEAIPESEPEQVAEPGADAVLTARAVIVVSILGAGFWYLLWRVAVHLIAAH